MDYNQKEQDAFAESEQSSFNIKEWALRFLHFWYLFVAAAVIALGLAFLQNRKWMPSYRSETKIMVETSSSNQYSFMQGFSTGGMSYRNSENYLILLGSYDLIKSTVEQLPFGIDYYSQGRFKTRSLYGRSPVTIKPQSLTDFAYEYNYKFSNNGDGSFTISAEDASKENVFSLKGHYGETIGNDILLLNVESSTDTSTPFELYFKFRSVEDLTNEFLYRLSIAYIGETSTAINISLVSTDSYRDLDFLNALAESYLNDNLNKKNQEAIRTIVFIDEQLGFLSDSLSSSEADLRAYRLANNIVDISAYRSELLTKLSAYDAKRQELTAKASYFDYLSRYLSQTTDENTLMAPTSIGVSDPTLLDLVAKYNTALQSRSTIGTQHPNYERYTKEMSAIKSQMLEVLKNVKSVYEIERKNFEKEVNTADAERLKAPEKEQRMIAFERRYKINDDYYTFLLQKRSEAQIRKASNTPDGYVLQKARVTALTNDGDKSKRYLTFLIIGLLLPAAFIVIKELLYNKIRTQEEIERFSAYPVIGSIRHTQGNDPVIAINHPKSAFAESLRIVRTRIEFALKRKKDIMVMITSAESGDGKTYFAANLAGAYGMMSRKTLLIDFDIRKPSLSPLLGDKSSVGSIHYLVGDVTLDQAIQKRDEFGFDFLPVGVIPPNPGELIRSEEVKEMLAELRKSYDYIILDTSPLGLVADAYALSTQADIMLIVARSGKTTKSFFRDFVTSLKNDRVNNVYIVLNDLNLKKLGYEYSGSGYGYGYGYGYGSKSNDQQYYGNSDFEKEELTRFEKFIQLFTKKSKRK